MVDYGIARANYLETGLPPDWMRHQGAPSHSPAARGGDPVVEDIKWEAPGL
jgi:hypothetical protein